MGLETRCAIGAARAQLHLLPVGGQALLQKIFRSAGAPRDDGGLVPVIASSSDRVWPLKNNSGNQKSFCEALPRKSSEARARQETTEVVCLSITIRWARAPLQSEPHFSKYLKPLGHSVWQARGGLKTTGSDKIHTFYWTRLAQPNDIDSLRQMT